MSKVPEPLQLKFDFMEPKEIRIDNVKVYPYARYTSNYVPPRFEYNRRLISALSEANHILEDLPWSGEDVSNS